MNKYQEAFHVLIEWGTNIIWPEEYYVLETLKELVNKTISMKPIRTIESTYCKSCGLEVDCYDKHCKHCGQKLDWEETK